LAILHGNDALNIESTHTRRAGLTLALCFCAAITEGIDLQSMGIAAAGIAAEFHLSKELGTVLAASPLGLFFGAFLGGRVADSWGRRNALVASIVVFALFQLITPWAPGFAGLVAIRFLCGVGLGGAFPNLIALTAEASGTRNNILNVVIITAGMPLGGAVASLIGFAGGPTGDWRVIFYVGGIAPLLLAPIMAMLLPESALFQQARAAAHAKVGVLSALFDRARVRQTLLLWMAFFCSALMLHLLLNWMPSLMVAKGFTKPQAFLIQMVFNLCSAAGSIGVAWIMQVRPNRSLLLLCYTGLGMALFIMGALRHDLVLVAATTGILGTCLIGAQFTLYGLTPTYYETMARGTGTGASVAASRLGSVAGPLLAGELLTAGATATQVLQSLLPITGVAALAALVLMFLPRPTEL
jgi:MFS transporter, AAHS family, 3-hydroxyphenylpropionic acid transporter